MCFDFCVSSYKYREVFKYTYIGTITTNVSLLNNSTHYISLQQQLINSMETKNGIEHELAADKHIFIRTENTSQILLKQQKKAKYEISSFFS